MNTYNSNKAWSPRPEKQTSTGHIGVYTNKTKNFMEAVEQTRDSIYNLSITENGAIGYKTTGKALLDMNFAVASLRGKSDKEITSMFRKAFSENPVYAIRWLFYCRDAREGLGERNLFRVCMMDMAINGGAELVNKLIPVIAEYGRWDDLWELLKNHKCCKSVISAVKAQKLLDDANYLANKPVSLMTKWLPSENTSSEKTREYAYIIRKNLHMTPVEYRKWLSRMRKYIDVVERKMSSNNWQAIDYESVPSKANLVYKNAFLKHDIDRRRCYLDALNKGEAKINSSVLYPHDIVSKYSNSSMWSSTVNSLDATLEGLWKALPNTVQGCGNTIVVADGSGSMCSRVGGSSTVTALDVANALAIYFAEHSSGDFKDKYITFSETPQIVDFSRAKTLHDKIRIALKHNECANTNIEAVFNLILKTAISNRMKQEDIPQNVLIISDCEFDSMADCGYGGRYNRSRPTSTLFDAIKNKYNDAGFSLPRLIFWNVNSRTNTIPVKENDLGVVLVSGFSINICKMVMSNKIDPYECLIEAIDVPRYDIIEEIFKKASI